jgi:hypothetical protein
MAQALEPILREADGYFMGESKLHETARALARLLDDDGIPYAISGALALAAHGRVRLTEDVAILLRREDLAAFKQKWLGRGYVEITPGLKAVRDTHRNVKVDFLLAGEFPGDGKPKPVAFPDPATEDATGEDLRVLSLRTLIELKLASGMTAAHRGQDLVDVMELIRVRGLSREYADSLNEYVRAKYLEQWQLARVRDDY